MFVNTRSCSGLKVACGFWVVVLSLKYIVCFVSELLQQRSILENTIFFYKKLLLFFFQMVSYALYLGYDINVKNKSNQISKVLQPLFKL